MRLFDDPTLLQSIIDGGIHLHLIRGGLRDKGLHVLSESPISNTKDEIYQIDTIPAILFHLRKATITQPRPEIFAIEVDGQTWPISQEETIQRILFSTWNAFARSN